MLQYERAFLAILKSKPHLEVQYEESTLKGEYKGKATKTCPDFYIRNTRRSNSEGLFLELTSASYPPGFEAAVEDPKIRQKAVLKQNGVKHIIFYLHHLITMAENHPEYVFGLEAQTIK